MPSAIPVDRLEAGDHACLTFTDAEERLDLLAAFVSTGIDRGEKVICYTESVEVDVLRGELVDRDLPAGSVAGHGQVRVVASERAWAGAGQPDARVMIENLTTELAHADREGYPALRVTTDMCWATRPQAGAEQLLGFESQVGPLFDEGRLTAICQYDRQSFDPVTLGFAARVHPRTVAATVYHEDPVLRICRQHVPPGVRVAGELDYTRADALGRALAEAVRLDHDVHLNLNHLQFLDVAAASVIVRVATGLPTPRRMFVVCREPVDRVLTAVGAPDIPALRRLVRHAGR